MVSAGSSDSFVMITLLLVVDVRALAFVLMMMMSMHSASRSHVKSHQCSVYCCYNMVRFKYMNLVIVFVVTLDKTKKAL